MSNPEAQTAMEKVKTDSDLQGLIESFKLQAGEFLLSGDLDGARNCVSLVNDCVAIWVKRGKTAPAGVKKWSADLLAKAAAVEGTGSLEVPMIELEPPRTTQKRNIDQVSPGGSQQVTEPPPKKTSSDLDEVIKALDFYPEEESQEGSMNWREVLEQLDADELSMVSLPFLVKLFEFKGFDAGKLAASIMKLKPSGRFKKAGSDVPSRTMDVLALVVIGMSRGANVEKVRRGLSAEGLVVVNALIEHYGIMSKSEDPMVPTFPRMVAVFPSVAMDLAGKMTLGPVTFNTMASHVRGYPRSMMCNGFPSLIPISNPDLADIYLSAYLLYQLEVSLVINTEFRKLQRDEQKRSVEGFARAAMMSSYCSEEQRVRQMHKHELIVVTRAGLSLPTTPQGQAIGIASNIYRRL